MPHVDVDGLTIHYDVRGGRAASAHPLHVKRIGGLRASLARWAARGSRDVQPRHTELRAAPVVRARRNSEAARRQETHTMTVEPSAGR
jgi:hypothetical protein